MYVDIMCVELSTTPQDESSRSRGSCWQETRRRMLLVDVFFLVGLYCNGQVAKHTAKQHQAKTTSPMLMVFDGDVGTLVGGKWKFALARNRRWMTSPSN